MVSRSGNASPKTSRIVVMRCAAESIPRLASFSPGTLRQASIFAGIEIDQQCALIEDEVAFEKTAGAADLAAVHLDIIARPVSRRHAELLQAKRGGLADAPRDFGKISHAQSCTIEHKFPANLPLVEIEAATAGDPPHGLDAVRLAVIELDLVAEELVDADQGAKGESAGTGSCRESCPSLRASISA